ncbi:hypothetical protein THIX_20252 [Thiomonas sp. X19]|nr:hypothetical protein THIX_20252 [Thiomonas sp. X19]
MVWRGKSACTASPGGQQAISDWLIELDNPAGKAKKPPVPGWGGRTRTLECRNQNPVP